MEKNGINLYGRIVLGCAIFMFGIVGIVGMTTLLSQGTASQPDAPRIPKFTDVSSGMYHTIALDEFGRVWVWGQNGHSQYGDGTTNTAPDYLPVLIPSDLRFLSRQITAITAGLDYNMALDDQGCVWAWGNNNYGQLGDNTTVSKNIPTIIPPARFDGKQIIKIVAANGYSFAIDAEGCVWAWGYNNRGQLGDGTTTNKTLPTLISDDICFEGTRITAIAASKTTAHHSLAFDDQGRVWAWGYNLYGQLGDDTTEDKAVPTLIPPSQFNNRQITSIAAGAYHSLAIDDEGCVWAWGYNTYGQLGNGTTAQRNVPTLIPPIRFNNRQITSIAAGENHSIVIDNEGCVWAWGYNVYGQLGDGTTGGGNDKNMPLLISYNNMLENRQITVIYSAYMHTFAIDDQGYVWAWGYNGYGQLGDGTTTQQYVPTLIIQQTLTSVTITFRVRGGSNISPVEIPYDATDLIDYKPIDPTRTNFRFTGWYKDEGLTQLFDFETETIPENNITLLAGWVDADKITITFETNTPEDTISSESVYPNSSVLHLPKRDPVRKGYIFDSWFKDISLTQKFDFSVETAPTADFTLYAGWTANTYTVVYNFNGGTHETLTGTVTFGKTFTLAVPKLDHHHFQGWFNIEGKQLTNTAGRSDTTIWDTDTNNVELFARWEKVKYNMRFDFDDSRPWQIVTHTYDELIPISMLPATPTREFAVFQCWTTPEGTEFDFTSTTMPANGISLTARWSVDAAKLQTLISNLQGYLKFDGFEAIQYNKFLSAMSEASEVAISSGLQTIESVKKSHDDLLATAVALTIADFTGRVIPPADFNSPNSVNIWIVISIALASISALVIGVLITFLLSKRNRKNQQGDSFLKLSE